MKVFQYFISLLFFSSFSYGNPVETGHASVSLVKFDTNLSAQNGLLTINLEKIIPDEKKPRTIEIKTPKRISG